MSVKNLVLCKSLPYFRCLYVAPIQKQAQDFSGERLKTTINGSPQLDKMLEKPHNVYMYRFKNSARVALGYASTNPDRLRGPTHDIINFDEIQDMIIKEVCPVVEESLFVSKYKFTNYAGTPKTPENGIEVEWQKSDRREWMVRCYHHSPIHYVKLGLDCIGVNSLVCPKCQNPLNVDDGSWVVTNKSGRFPGYHISQLQCSFADYNNILSKLEMQDEDKIQNEMLGESFGEAKRPTNKAKLQAACTRRPISAADEILESYTRRNMYAGIDWGRGIKSATVISIGCFVHDRFRFLFIRKWIGRNADPSICMPEIKQLLRVFHIDRAHVDWGDGAGMFSDLQDFYGDKSGIRVTSNYWSSSIGAKKVKYDEGLCRYVCNRTYSMAQFFSKIGSEVEFFRWQDFEEFAQDFLNIHQEFRKNGDPYFDHTGPDDVFHACLYAYLIACWDNLHDSL